MTHILKFIDNPPYEDRVPTEMPLNIFTQTCKVIKQYIKNI